MTCVVWSDAFVMKFLFTCVYYTFFFFTQRILFSGVAPCFCSEQCQRSGAIDLAP